MAASARTRKRKPSTTAKLPPAPKRPPLLLRLFGHAGTALFRWMQQISVPEQIKREIVAVLAFCCAGLLTLSLVGYAGKMTVVGVAGDGLSWLGGKGVIFA